MDDLIARLEKATGPDRALDRSIHREISKRLIADETVVSYIGPGGTTRTLTFAYPYRWALWGCPRYTRSIDAALALVPEDWGWLVNQPRTELMWARFFPPSEDPDIDEWGAESGDVKSTPAIAICIAALKARAAQSGSE